MNNNVEKAVLRAIDTMYEQLGEELTIDDIARAALFSKFHFSRIFQRVTGLSPGRFLSAVRLQEAKRLLVTTPLPVTEISVRVGYSSVGTFSSRFKYCVGVSPTVYRRYGRVTPPSWAGGRPRAGHKAAVGGYITSVSGDRPVFAGLFPDPILQGLPVRCTMLRGPGSYVLDDVPLGAWHLMALAPGQSDPAVVGGAGPIVIRPDTGTRRADVRLRPKRRVDPPVLLALSGLQPE